MAEGDPPDTLFALLAGLYLGILAGTLAVAVARRALTDVGLLYTLLLVVVTAVTVGGMLAAGRLPGLAVRLGATRWAWLVGLVPTLGTMGVLALDVMGAVPVPGADALLALFGGFGAGLVGFVLVVMAVTRWVAHELADASTHATWRAPWPRRERRLVLWTGVALLIGGTVGLVAGAALQRQPIRILGQVVIPAGVVLATVGQPRTYRAMDAGLEIKLPTARRLVPWEAVRDYRLTEDALVIRRRGRLSFGYRFDREAIEDLDAVVAALDRFVG